MTIKGKDNLKIRIRCNNIYKLNRNMLDKSEINL